MMHTMPGATRRPRPDRSLLFAGMLGIALAGCSRSGSGTRNNQHRRHDRRRRHGCNRRDKGHRRDDQWCGHRWHRQRRRGHITDRCDVGVYDSANPPKALTLTGNLGAHDPSAIESNGTYYEFQTGLGAKTSTNLTTWSGASAPFAAPAWMKSAVSGVTDLWAPDISYFRRHLSPLLCGLDLWV
jgi:hypothetical protein